MIRELQQLGDFLFIVSGRVSDHMLAKSLMGESCLPQSRSAAAIEILAEIRERFPARKSLQSQHQLTARGLLHLA